MTRGSDTVRIDSGATHLVWCRECHHLGGPYGTKAEALEDKTQHQIVHQLEREAERQARLKGRAA